MPKVISMSEALFESRKEAGNLPVEVIIRVAHLGGGAFWAYSLEGYGAIYYDTQAEAEDAHG